MRARDAIVIARRRAGLTQQDLAKRLEVPQATVARWESGFSEAKFETVQRAVAACDLELTFGFANEDRGSWTSLIYDQLALSPAERVWDLSHDRFDRIDVMQAIGSSGLRAIVVGEVAGALHGWPLLLSQQGDLDVLVHGNDLALARELVAGMADAERIGLVDALPGTAGYADLARNAVSMDVDGVSVRVAALIDLVRVAHSENGRFSRRFARAFDETLRLTERLRETPRRRRKLTDQQAQEEMERWLKRQKAA